MPLSFAAARSRALAAKMSPEWASSAAAISSRAAFFAPVDSLASAGAAA